MSMHPDIKIVLGIEIRASIETVESTVTKYNADTGEPYEKPVSEEKRVLPDWLQKAWDEKREGDAWHSWYPRGEIGVYPDPTSNTVFLVGKLIAMVDPREMGDDILTLETPTSDDKVAVLKWLTDAGAPPGQYKMTDIKLRIGTDWL